ncbi:MAG: FAD-dependent oxidoreductase [Bacteroidota bacterium]|nr:FAD-dependent oxidoreductase [Bacteroidota bacterium]
MQTDTLIVGQGICGSMLAWWLEQAGLSFVVMDEPRPFTASRVAAGLINPVTGRRIVKTWMIDELLPFAVSTYREIGATLGIDCISPARVIEFFPTPQMRHAFLDRYADDREHLVLPVHEGDWRAQFQYDLGYGIIRGCQLVDLPALLEATRKRLKEHGRLREERFEQGSLLTGITDVRYRDIQAGRVIICYGVESTANPLFSRLPFAPNKGEFLIIEASDLVGRGDIQTVFKKGISLAPWKEGLYWVGSSYEWSFDEEGPTESFLKRTGAILKDWLNVPYKIVGHYASVRPATLERRPFVGFHPLHPQVGILNGMGTKGCSLAPFFSYQLVEHITKGIAIRPDADVRRFTKVLSHSS